MWEPAVLDGLSEDANIQAGIITAFRHLMVVMARAGNNVTHDERQVAVALGARFLGTYTRSDFERDVRTFPDSTAEEALSRFAVWLAERDRVAVLETAIRLAAADGTLSQPEVTVIHDAAATLGIGLEELNGIAKRALGPEAVLPERGGGTPLESSHGPTRDVSVVKGEVRVGSFVVRPIRPDQGSLCRMAAPCRSRKPAMWALVDTEAGRETAGGAGGTSATCRTSHSRC